MILEDIIEELVAGLSGYSLAYLEADDAEQNLNDPDLEGKDGLAYVDLIPRNDTLPKSGILSARSPISIFFGKKSEPDWTTKQHRQDAIEPMMLAARRFITAMQRDNRIREVVGGRRLGVKNLFDTNLSGVILTVEVIVVDGDSICA